ncbi:hypothetical protein ACFSC6_18855 [Rufibacter sediminis]|uniref:ABC transporter ATPase n=1 Tax=Rufibacter sediminis TaxID=2762756 RepID=A0ABR6VRP9_9BACT|nr:hypothetical protein [Rufibacter sediminis]MBC3539587.1 hypothetical protein [Rufibacter sediminis]
MYVPFEQLPPYSRVWVYQMSRPLTEEEEGRMNQLLQDFVTEWSSHGRDLQASFSIKEHHFLFLATNEEVASASGCSIDKSVAFLRQLEQEFNVQLFDRTQLAFKTQAGVQTVPMTEMKAQVAAGALSPDSLYFDTLIPTVGALQEQWPKPAKDTWLARYFQGQ